MGKKQKQQQQQRQHQPQQRGKQPHNTGQYAATSNAPQLPHTPCRPDSKSWSPRSLPASAPPTGAKPRRPQPQPQLQLLQQHQQQQPLRNPLATTTPQQKRGRVRSFSYHSAASSPSTNAAIFALQQRASQTPSPASSTCSVSYASSMSYTSPSANALPEPPVHWTSDDGTASADSGASPFQALVEGVRRQERRRLASDEGGDGRGEAASVVSADEVRQRGQHLRLLLNMQA